MSKAEHIQSGSHRLQSTTTAVATRASTSKPIAERRKVKGNIPAAYTLSQCLTTPLLLRWVWRGRKIYMSRWM